jgi:hypothetical protein
VVRGLAGEYGVRKRAGTELVERWDWYSWPGLDLRPLHFERELPKPGRWSERCDRGGDGRCEPAVYASHIPPFVNRNLVAPLTHRGTNFHYDVSTSAQRHTAGSPFTAVMAVPGCSETAAGPLVDGLREAALPAQGLAGASEGRAAVQPPAADSSP